MLFDLFKSVQKMELEPVVVLLGTDGFVREKLRNTLIDRALGPAIREMNLAKFQGGDEELNRAMEACRDYPCFAEKRVVWIGNAEKIKKKDSQEILKYLEEVQPTTLLILEGEKLDGRLDWVKALKKNGKWVEIPEATREECAAWVRKCLQGSGKKFAPEVPDRMVELLGNSIGGLKLAVDQLILYVGRRETITCEDVEELFIKVSEEDIFGVVDSLIEEKTAKREKSFQALLETGEAPLKILALLFRHLSILLSLQDKKSHEGRGFPLPPFLKKKYEAQLRRFSRPLSISLLKPLARADREMKGSCLHSDLILKNCVDEVQALLGHG